MADGWYSDDDDGDDDSSDCAAMTMKEAAGCHEDEYVKDGKVEADDR